MNSGSYQTSRMAEVRHVLWIVLLLNMLVALAKFFYGLATNSHSMQADGIHSVFDSMGNVAWLGSRLPFVLQMRATLTGTLSSRHMRAWLLAFCS